MGTTQILPPSRIATNNDLEVVLILANPTLILPLLSLKVHTLSPPSPTLEDSLATLVPTVLEEV